MPKRTGRHAKLVKLGIVNLKPMCAECNGFRARCFDCWAMAACVDALAQGQRKERKRILGLWNVSRVRETLFPQVFPNFAAPRPTLQDVWPGRTPR